MSNINLNEKENDKPNIKNIFKKKTKLGAVIQFNLLQEIIEEFIERQKEMEEKIDNLEYRLNPSHINEKEVNEINIDLEENEIKEEEKKVEKDKNKSEKEFLNFKPKKIKNFLDKNDGEKTNYKLDNLINVLSTKIDRLENINKEITKKIISLNKERQKEIEEIINNTYPKLKENEEGIKSINETLNHMQTKLDEVSISGVYNIPDINMHANNNQDNPLSLIKVIEQKISKKLELIDSKTKSYDDQIASIKASSNLSKNKCDSAINLSNILKENYNNLVNDIYINNRDMKNKFEEQLKSINEKLEKKIIDSKEELIKYTNDKSKKLNDIIFENLAAISTTTPQKVNKIDTKMFINLTNEKINNLSSELKQYFNKSINNSEKYLKSLINNIPIEKVKKDIMEIQQDLSNKLVKKDLNYLNPKFEKIENKYIDFENDLYDFKKDMEKFSETCSRTVKMVDYLGGQVIQSYQPDLEKIKEIEESKAKIDTSYYLSKNIFKDEINIIYKKLEKMVEFQRDNYKSIQDLENKLKLFVSENDLNNLEHCLMNIFEEFKISISKKYLEKSEAQKNFKYLELQIKNISDNNLMNANNNNNNSENWLLAKKPINSYICASCESYIGDLNNKSQYLPWNKMLSRDEKKYRMGHGFSKMLQMINSDLLKNAEKINMDLTMKNSDKKNINYLNNSVFSEGKQLPRINSQINFHKMNINNQTPREVNLEYNEIVEKENSENSSNNINLKNNYENGINSYISRNIKNEKKNDNNNPKLLKIYKKIKK